MKRICCHLAQTNNLLGHTQPLFWFIGVHLVHLYGQLADKHIYPMNQMNPDVLVCCLWQKVWFVIYSAMGAMNLGLRRFIEVH